MVHELFASNMRSKLVLEVDFSLECLLDFDVLEMSDVFDRFFFETLLAFDDWLNFHAFLEVILVSDAFFSGFVPRMLKSVSRDFVPYGVFKVM